MNQAKSKILPPITSCEDCPFNTLFTNQENELFINFCRNGAGFLGISHFTDNAPISGISEKCKLEDYRNRAFLSKA